MAYSGFSIIFTETKSKGQETARVIVTCVGPIRNGVCVGEVISSLNQISFPYFDSFILLELDSQVFRQLPRIKRKNEQDAR